MYPYIQLVERHVVSEVPVQPIRFLYQQDPARSILPEVLHHLPETGSSGALRSLDIDELPDNRKAMLSRVVHFQLLLCRNRIAFLLLVLRGNTRIADGLNPL